MEIMQVTEMLQKYFNAFFETDIKELSNLFHEAAHIYGHDENNILEDIDKENFLKIVSSFSPNSENPDFVRNDEILGIDFISKDVAVARVKLRFSSSICTDILNLIRLDGKWRIISVLDSKEPIENY